MNDGNAKSVDVPAGPAVLLFRGRGIVAWLIRWLTRSCWSHAALLTDVGTVIESRPGSGVHEVPASGFDWAVIDVFDVDGIEPGQWDKAIFAARADVGKVGYDYWGDLKFVLGMEDDDRLKFCSEGVISWLWTAGVMLVARTQAWKVSPAMIGGSTRLVERKNDERIRADKKS
jgi:uncharacterized protein YycO